MAISSTLMMFRSAMKLQLVKTTSITGSCCCSYFPKKNFHKSATVYSPSLKSFRSFYRQLFIPKANEPPYTHITQVGDPVLRRVSDDVPDELLNTDEIKFLIELMVKVMRKYDCVGISAPQIGIPLRVMALEFKESNKDVFDKNYYKKREMETLPLTVFINPKLKVLNYTKNIYEESCGSVKGYCADVPRFQEVEIIGKNESGELYKTHFKGWNARIAQHEYDHLHGKLFTDIMDITSFHCSCWEAVNARDGRVKIQYHEK